MSERLRQGLQPRNKHEKVTDPWRGRTKQRGKNSRLLAASGRVTASAPAAPGRQENRQEEADQGSTMERTKNPPKPVASERNTRKEGTSGCRAQSWATDRGTNPSRQKWGWGTKDNPRPLARAGEVTLNPNKGQWRTLERAKDNRSSWTQRGSLDNTPWGTGRADTRRQRWEVQPGLTSVPDPNGETKPSFRSRTNNPRPRRGDPIAKVGNPRGEEKPLEPVDQEPDGGRKASRKHKKAQAQP